MISKEDLTNWLKRNNITCPACNSELELEEKSGKFTYTCQECKIELIITQT